MIIMTQVGSAAQFRPNEWPMLIWRAGQKVPATGFDEDSSHINGILLATGQRLIFIEEKGLIGKNYRARESIDYRAISGWQVQPFMGMKSLQIDLIDGWNRRRTFHNLIEVDPMTLKPLTPQPAERVKAQLEQLTRGGQ